MVMIAKIIHYFFVNLNSTVDQGEIPSQDQFEQQLTEILCLRHVEKHFVQVKR